MWGSGGEQGSVASGLSWGKWSGYQHGLAVSQDVRPNGSFGGLADPNVAFISRALGVTDSPRRCVRKWCLNAEPGSFVLVERSNLAGRGWPAKLVQPAPEAVRHAPIGGSKAAGTVRPECSSSQTPIQLGGEEGPGAPSRPTGPSPSRRQGAPAPKAREGCRNSLMPLQFRFCPPAPGRGRRPK